MPENDPTLEFYNSLMCDQMTPKQADSAATAGDRECALQVMRAVRAATAGDRECALQVMRAVRNMAPAVEAFDVVLGLEYAKAAGDIIAAHVAAATAKERQARELAEGENARLREALGRIRLLCSSDYNERDPFDQIAPICMEALKP